jgi:hypothetical protein
MKPKKSKHHKSKYRKRGKKASAPSAILPFFLFPFLLDYCYIALFNKSKVAEFSLLIFYAPPLIVTVLTTYTPLICP